MARSSCSAGPMAFLTQQNTKNVTHGRVFHVCILLPPAQPTKFVPPAATHLLHAPSPPPSSRTPERDHKVTFWCLSAQPSTFYHPGTKNVTTGSCSLCLGGFPYPRHPFHYPVRPVTKFFFVSGSFPIPQTWTCNPSIMFFVSGVSHHPSHSPLPPRHEECDHRVMFFMSGCFSALFSTIYHPDLKNATTWPHYSGLGSFPHPIHEHATPPASCSSCLGCSTTLPTTHYHPDTKNATTGSCFSFLGCPSTFPSTLYCPDMKNATMWFFASGVFPHFPAIPLTQTHWRMRPLGHQCSCPSCLGYSPKNPLIQTWKHIAFSCPSPSKVYSIYVFCTIKYK